MSRVNESSPKFDRIVQNMKKWSLMCEIHCFSFVNAATHCNTLQHTATHCNTWINDVSCVKYAALHFFTLQHTATHCITLQHAATHCNTWINYVSRVKYAVSHCFTLQHVATHCNTLQHTALTSEISHFPTKAHTCEFADSVNVMWAVCCSMLQHVVMCCSVLQV